MYIYIYIYVNAEQRTCFETKLGAIEYTFLQILMIQAPSPPQKCSPSSERLFSM